MYYPSSLFTHFNVDVSGQSKPYPPSPTLTTSRCQTSTSSRQQTARVLPLRTARPSKAFLAADPLFSSTRRRCSNWPRMGGASKMHAREARAQTVIMLPTSIVFLRTTFSDNHVACDEYNRVDRLSESAGFCRQNGATLIADSLQFCQDCRARCGRSHDACNALT